MRLSLRLTAFAMALVVTAFWFFSGPNLGWTKTSVTRMEKDPVTENEYPVIEKRFLAGIDFLAAGFLAAGLVYAMTLLPMRRRTANTFQ